MVLSILALSAFEGLASAQIVLNDDSTQVPARRPPPRVVVRKPARPPRPWYVSGAAIAPSTPTFGSTTQVEEFFETGSRTVNYTTARRPALDAGAGVRVIRRLFVGGAVSAFAGVTSGDLTAEIPHPLQFNRKRSLSAPVADLERQELGFHIQAATLVPISRRLRVLIAGGPTLFRVRQELISAISYEQEFPYETVAFGSAATEFQARTAVGFHAQAGLTALFSRRLGADVLVRYSKAKTAFDGSDGSTFDAEVGGVQLGIGVRAIF